MCIRDRSTWALRHTILFTDRKDSEARLRQHQVNDDCEPLLFFSQTTESAFQRKNEINLGLFNNEAIEELPPTVKITMRLYHNKELIVRLHNLDDEEVVHVNLRGLINEELLKEALFTGTSYRSLQPGIQVDEMNLSTVRKKADLDRDRLKWNYEKTVVENEEEGEFFQDDDLEDADDFSRVRLKPLDIRTFSFH
eukprot:TRINITY_DN11924_c0_g1_i2.p2 TRINITY_DN11924_c0_g1~~TRINITY_DN11924_c0_g1_i2.p2  ORF type:complete len:195 (-),score=31.78 TRINITY_DN11924_c0_g1_i2:126-710(-)